MDKEIAVKNTLVFLFPESANQPTLVDMAHFVKSLKGDRSSMETAYKISDEKSVFIRFKTEDAMKFVLENNQETLPFLYTNGTKIMVVMSEAGRNTRYVRIFDLPPEIPDSDVSSVMARYGKIKRLVRERFPAEYQLDMFTGVRGVYMEVDSGIPEALYFRNMKGRIYYDGLKLRCFSCKSDTHLKKCCPVLQERRVAFRKQKELEKIDAEEEVLAAAVDVSEAKPGSDKQKSKKLTRKVKTIERQQCSRVEPAEGHPHKTDSASNSSPCEEESFKVTVNHSPHRKTRCRIASYEWIEDENERQLLIAEDRIRIANAMNVKVDEIDFYIDK